MLTPEYLDGVAEPLQQIFSELQIRIQADIARRIAKADLTITDTAAWQINKLQELGKSQAAIQKEISRALNISEKEIKTLFKAAGIKSLKTDIDLQKAAIEAGKLPTGVVPLSASPAIAQVLSANARRTVNTLRNLTQTTAIDAAGKLTQYLDTAQLMVQSGAFTQDQAVDVAVRQLAADGVAYFDYMSGARTTVEAGVRRAVVTGINQATAEISLANAAELETDLVEVTSHGDARPSHAEWQGKIYSLSGTHPKYRSLRDATGYGTVSGLCGANCRHSFYAFIEGVSEQVPKEEYDPETYKAEQQQRYNERMIRSWKRRAATLEAGGVDNTKELLKVREWQRRLQEHLDETGLPRLPAREQVPGFGRRLSSKAVQAAKRNTAIKSGSFTQSSISQKSVGAAENWAKKTLGAAHVTYTGQSVDVVNEVNRTLKKIFKEYPSLNGFVDEIKFDNIPAVARASLSHRNGALKATLTFSDSRLQDLAAIKKMIDAQVKAQYWSPKDGLLGISKHECVHLLEYAYTLRKYGVVKVGSDPADIAKAFAAIRRGEVSGDIRKQALAACNLADDPDIIKANLSDYANVSSLEFLAEAVSEHNPRKLARAAIDLFKKLLGVK
jgi:hypothetical protein